MERQKLMERISIDPEVCFGKPCVKGRRMWVSLVLDLLASGMKTEEIAPRVWLERRGCVGVHSLRS